ncbi:MAG: YceI family protein [Myxococcota bacterium]
MFALWLLLPGIADASMSIDGKPKVTFFATGSPGFMSIEGVTSTMTLADDGTRLTFTVPMDTVDSGISLRDEHMNKNYVQTDKFPNAIIDFARADMTWPTEIGKSVDGKVAGNFTAHGVTKPTTITYTATKTKTGFKIKGRFDYDCNAHGMVIEPYMGISFDPKMYATVVVDLIDAP